MKHLLIKYLKPRLANIFLAIAIAIPVAFVTWFFVHVVFGVEVVFTDLLKVTYLAIYAFDFSFSSIALAIIILRADKIAAKLEVPINDVLDLKIKFEVPFDKMETMTSEEFKSEIALNRLSYEAAAAFAKAFAEVISKSNS